MKTDLADSDSILSRNASSICLYGVLGLFTFSLIWPGAAFPMRGVFAGFAILCLFALTLPNQKGLLGRVLRAPESLLFIGWAVLWGLSQVVSGTFYNGVDDVANVTIGVMAFLVIFAGLAGRGEGGLPPAARWLAIALSLEALFGLYQLYGPAGFPRTFATMERMILETMSDTDPLREGMLHAVREGRASGTIGAPNIFASLCVFGTMVSAGCAFAAERLPQRIAFGAGAAICAAATVASGSNGGVVALMAGVVSLAAILLSYKLEAKKVRLLAIVALLLIALIGLTIAAIALFAPTQGTRWLGGSGFAQRLYYWQTATAIWLDHPILGAGPGGFESFYPQYRLPGSGETKVPHSWFFLNLASVGLGILLMIGGILATAWRAAGSMGRMKSDGTFHLYAMMGGVAAAGFAILFHGLAEYTFSFREGGMLFFLAAGILAGTASRERKDKLPAWVIPGGGVAIAALAAVSLYTNVYTPAQGIVARETAGYLLMDGAAPPEEVLEAYTEAVDRQPRDPRNWESRGIFYLRLGDRTKGMNDLKEALRRDPRSARLHQTIAESYWEAGDRQRALEYQREAVDLHPLDVSHRLTLAEMLLESGDEEEAAEIWRSTEGLLRTSLDEKERQEKLGQRLGLSTGQN